MFGGWEFLYIDSRGRFGDIISGWRCKTLSLSHLWLFAIGLGFDLYS